MAAIWLGMVTAIKNILFKVLSVKFFEWLFFFAAEMFVESTKTNKDDKFLQKIKELYYEGERE